MKKWKKIVRYYIQDKSKNISSNMRLFLQKDNTYSGGTYSAISFRFLFQAKLFVRLNKHLCHETRIAKRVLFHSNVPRLEDLVEWR